MRSTLGNNTPLSKDSGPRRNSSPGSVLVVDDHRSARESMVDILRQSGHEVDSCSSAAEALNTIRRKVFDCIVTDLKMPGMTGVEFIVQLEQRRYGAQVVMVTAHASVATAVEAMRHGAFDYIEKPFDIDQLERLTNQAIEHKRLLNESGTNAAGAKSDEPSISAARPAADAIQSGTGPPPMIGSSREMQALRERIARVAPTSETVLITGESGTGKELVAAAIHAASQRGDGPLVSLNCPVLSAQLMESELFGHEKGAFTGADNSRTGRFEMAAGGSILLDEVTEIDLPLQAKLLRVLQERSFERVGSSQTINVDVRVMATSNRDLEIEVAEGRLRNDLYYRLAVVPIHVPPLRQRAEDISELIEFFRLRSAQRLGREACQFDSSARTLMANYHWPGNVRELENVVTRASVLGNGKTIMADDLTRWLAVEPSAAVLPLPTASNDCATQKPEEIPIGLSLQETERMLIEATLEHFDGHRAKTAKALGIGIRTLSGKLRQYGYAPRAKSLLKAG